ncbi:MAG: hypothetical protein ACKVP5_00790 [Aestuariivirga sp.]
MTFEESIALLPQWVQLWLYWLLFGGFVLPLALLYWRQTRLAAVVVIAAGIAAGFTVNWIYAKLGYVKLLGLGHIPFWTPAAIFLFYLLRRGDLPIWAYRIMAVVFATLAISLAFDYADVLRYALGERTPLAMPKV